MTNVVDANCWSEYVDAWISQTTVLGRQVFDLAEENGGFLFDLGDQIKHQYVSLRVPLSAQLFEIWFERMVLNDKMTLVDLSGKDSYFKVLTQIGLPKKEHVYFKVGIHGGAERIISLDIDFFEPALKQAKGAQKQRVKLGQSGGVCRFMKKQFGVTILTPFCFLEECGVGAA